MRRITLVLLLIAAASVVIVADVPRPTQAPKQNPSIDTNLHISLKSDAKEARLIIPKDSLKQLRAQLDQIDQGGDVTAAASITSASSSRIQTIVGGLFLSAAIVFGGIWFARNGRSAPKSSAALVIFAVVAALGSAATFVYGNAGPPPEARSVTGKMFSDYVHIYKFGYGPIKLELADGDGDVTLIVPDPKDKPKTDDDE
jgi:hypothetical protein